MKIPGLRTQMVFVIFFIQLYALGAGLSYWVQSRAHLRLEDSLRRDLVVLAKLPRLRDALRQLDATTDDYLLSGNVGLLKKREDTLRNIRKIESELSALVFEERERGILQEMERLISSYLAQQNQWIARKGAGRLSRSEATQLRSRRGLFDQLTNLLVGMKQTNVETLENRAQAVGRASRVTLILILLTGLAAGGFIAFVLSRYLVGPVSELQRHAKSWELGQAWNFTPPHASPEISDLLDCLQEMTRRLNSQYGKEHELLELKGRLVSMVSHEFNNSLSILIGVSTLLRESEAAPPNEKRADYYGILDGNIRSMAMASRNLLDMARLESGKFAVRPRKMDLSVLLKESVNRLKPLYARKAQEVRLDMPQPLAPVFADPEALSLVATNLLGNAIKYTPDNGIIVIGAEAPAAGKIRVYFKDSGIGIAPEDQKRILSGYYRTESGKRAAKGFGVGLALANSIIEAHESALCVDSAPGKGSLFSFLLPLWTPGTGATDRVS